MEQSELPGSAGRRLVRRIVNLMPRMEVIFRLCRKYVDYYCGDNNADFYTNGELVLLQKYLPKSDAVLDVGANIGDWARIALRINPRISLHCFEPSAQAFARLQTRGFPSNVVLNRIGMSSSPRDLVLNVPDDTALGSVYTRPHIFDDAAMRAEVIRVDTLDAYCGRSGILRIDFAKIDVEGHELEVFKGMRELLENDAVGVIQFEYGGCNLDARSQLLDIWNYFSKIGSYRFYKLFPYGPKLVPRYTRSLETFQYSNWAVISDSYADKIARSR